MGTWIRSRLSLRHPFRRRGRHQPPRWSRHVRSPHRRKPAFQGLGAGRSRCSSPAPSLPPPQVWDWDRRPAPRIRRPPPRCWRRRATTPTRWPSMKRSRRGRAHCFSSTPAPPAPPAPPHSRRSWPGRRRSVERARWMRQSLSTARSPPRRCEGRRSSPWRRSFSRPPPARPRPPSTPTRSCDCSRSPRSPRPRRAAFRRLTNFRSIRWARRGCWSPTGAPRTPWRCSKPCSARIRPRRPSRPQPVSLGAAHRRGGGRRRRVLQRGAQRPRDAGDHLSDQR